MARFNLEISVDQMAAYLHIESCEADQKITFEEIKSLLAEKNVVFGIKEDKISEALEKPSAGDKILVAEGRPAFEGKDGNINYYFDPDPSNAPRERDDGRLDFHHLNKIQNISKGEKLAEIIPPVEGKPGMNVLGETLPPEECRDVNLIGGENTFSNEDGSIIFSKIDGVVVIKADRKIEVSPEVKIDGDIDHSTGDLEIKGDLYVSGDVKSGFKISASGLIEIGGTVEEAQVVAGGSITVKGGFVGEGGGIINAGGEVYIKFITRQKAIAGGNIEVYEEARNAFLSSAGTISVTKGKGIIVGGESRAVTAIEVNTLGAPQNITTLVVVADTSPYTEKIISRQREIEGLKEKQEGMCKKTSLLTRKMKKVGLKEDETRHLTTLNKITADIDLTIDALRLEIKEAENIIDSLKKTAYLRVNNRIFPGVTMKIAGTAKAHENERDATEFKVFNGEIIGIEDTSRSVPQAQSGQSA